MAFGWFAPAHRSAWLPMVALALAVVAMPVSAQSVAPDRAIEAPPVPAFAAPADSPVLADRVHARNLRVIARFRGGREAELEENQRQPGAARLHWARASAATSAGVSAAL